MEMGLLVLRLAVGAAFVAQGVSKLRPRNRDGVAAYFASSGFEPGRRWGLLAGLTEIGAGAALAAGLLTPLGAAAALGVLLPALVVNGASGWSVAKGGAEYPTVMTGAVLALALTGAGEWSLDHALGLDAAGAGWALVAVALAVAASGPLLVRRAAVLRARQGAARRDSAAAMEAAA